MQRGFFGRVGAGALAMLLGMMPPAAAETVTIADLDGFALKAEAKLEQTIRREGQTLQVTITHHWTVSVDTDSTVSFVQEATAMTPGGLRKAKPNRGIFAIDEVMPVKSRGTGDAVWKFQDGVLTFIRTFPSGAFRASFAFSREGDRLTCTLTTTMARENGKVPIRLESPFAPGEVTILKASQASSTCRMAKAVPSDGASR